jgi:hypothetical protein
MIPVTKTISRPTWYRRFLYKVINESNKITFGLDINKLLVPSAPVATGNYSVDYQTLPTTAQPGVISSWFKSFSDGTNQLNSLQASLGAEYVYNDQFFVRAGYFYENKNRGNRKFFSVGAGFNDDLKYQFLLSCTFGKRCNRNPLSNTLRLESYLISTAQTGSR